MITKEEFETNCAHQSYCRECCSFKICQEAAGLSKTDLHPYRKTHLDDRYDIVVKHMRKKKLAKLLA